MTSRQIPSFLKRATKRDANPSMSSNSSSSSVGASRSIRFSSLGSTDYDIFSTPGSSTSEMSHPLELLADKEEPAEEAILVNFAAADAPLETLDEASPGNTEAACETLSRPPSVSAPPEVTPRDEDCILSSLVMESDEEVTAKEDSEGLELSGESMTSSIKKSINAKTCVESSDLLDDIDKTFDSVPKPANKPRKLPSAYAKSRSKASITKVTVPRATEPLLDLEQEEQDLQLREKTSQVSSLPTAVDAAANSVFDQEDPTLESRIPLSASAPDLEEIRHKALKVESPSSTSHQASKESSPVSTSPPTTASTNPRRWKIASSSSFQTTANAPRASKTSPPPTPSTSSPSFTPTSCTNNLQEAQEPQAEGHQPGPTFEVSSLLRDKRFIIAAAFALSAICLRVLPSASFFIGFFWGAGMVLGLSYLYRVLNTRSQPRELFQSVPELRDLPPPNVPHVAEEPDDGGGIFRGWLNELNVYVPESYHINQTSSVYVSLDGTQLRIQRPKQSIQKRAMWNEVVPTGGVNFIHQRHFEMMGAKVSLEPAGLVKKRVWSKKYPICIEFPVANVVGTASASSRTSKTSRRSQGPPVTDDFEWLDEKEVSMERIFLFARTCREKEEWFRRFEAAAKGKPLQLSIRRIVSSYLEDDRNSVFAASNASSVSNVGTSDNSGAASTSVSFSSLSGGASVSGSGGQGASSSASEALSVPLGSGLDQWSDRLSGSEREPLAVTYTRYMARFMPADWLSKAAKSHRLSVNYISCDPQVLWLNAILGRGVWDLLREKIWADKVKQKIQNKLRKIHLPYFIDELSVVEISLGKDFPVIRRAGKPFLDRRGLWVELDIAYCGGSSMALETKVNLMKLRRPKPDNVSDQKASAEPTFGGAASAVATGSGKATSGGSDVGAGVPSTLRRAHSHHHHSRAGAFCSEEEDSAESTTDSELDENPEADIVTDPDKGNHVGGGTSRKLLRFVDRLSRSSYFHKAIENKFIQRGMEFVSNTRIVLHVEVRGLSGTLLVNIPPPPTDRLWYGFKPCPKLILAARPKVGAKELTMNRLTEWIEKKLELEFQRIFVLPNMDDLVVPLLLSGNPENTCHTEAASYATKS